MVDDVTIIDLVSGVCRYLKMLNLTGCKITHKCILPILQNQKSMSRLYLSEALSENGPHRVVHEFNNAVRVETNGIDTRDRIGVVESTHQSFEAFFLSRCAVDSYVLSLFIPFCINLETIVLSECKLLDDEDISALVINSRSLLSLDVAMCNRVSDLAMKRIAECCPFMQKLVLNGCISVTDVGLKALIQNCPSLTTLVLTGTSVTYDSVNMVKGCTALQTLSLACTLVQNAQVQELRKAIPHVQIQYRSR
jgi:hypothetical protein